MNVPWVAPPAPRINQLKGASLLSVPKGTWHLLVPKVDWHLFDRYVLGMKLCIGAYAASPSANGFQRETEALYYQGLRAFDFVSGLEIPFLGSLHAVDSGWFLDQLSPDWNSVLTPIPGVMGKLSADPMFGLASRDAGGRERALDFMRSLLEGVTLMNRHFGRQVVTAVEVHSAPTLGGEGVKSSVENFAASLTELRSWNWEGAHLCVEHCDRYLAGQSPAKGFLSVGEELQALTLSSGATPAGMLINWGRSAIEGRSALAPEHHLNAAKEAGFLNGLIFSGCTVDSGLYGTWSDSHAPFQTAGSLLSAERARSCMEIAGFDSLRVFGFKMQALPKTMSVEERLKFLKSNAEFCSEVAAHLQLSSMGVMLL